MTRDIQHKTRMDENDIDEVLMGTFPASDPPSWTLGHDPDRDAMKVMRIHQYGGPEQLHYEIVSIPQIADKEILVRIMAASVNPIDCKLASGALRPVMNNKGVPLPWVPGGDFSGVVEGVGQGVSQIEKGDAIYGNSPGGGAYAQFIVAKVDTIALKPRNFTFIQAAAVPIAGQTAWQALFDHGKLQSGQTVLIHGGSGGVGSFAIQLARWKGARVLATGSGDHVEYLQDLGAHQSIDYKTTPFDSVAKDLDLVIDLIGGETQERSFKVLKPGGCLVTTVDPPSQDLAQKHRVTAVMMSMKPSVEQLNKLSELLDARIIKANVTKVYPLHRAQEAWKEILSHHSKGKTVLQV